MTTPLAAPTRRGLSAWAIAGLLLASLAALVGFFVALVFGLGASFRATEPYRAAFERAQAHEGVASRLGRPIEESGMPGGSHEVDGDGGGRVSIAVPVRGPNGEGLLFVEGFRERGAWHYTRMGVHPRGADPIELRDDRDREGWPP